MHQFSEAHASLQDNHYLEILYDVDRYEMAGGRVEAHGRRQRGSVWEEAQERLRRNQSHIRPGGGVRRQRQMDVGQDARVGGGIRAGDADGAPASTPTADVSPVARHGELDAGGGHNRVQGERLGAQLVVAVGEADGDGHVHLAAVGVEGLGALVVIVARASARLHGPRVGENLAPARRGQGAGGCVRDLGEVDLRGAEVLAADGLPGSGAVAELLWGGDGD